MADLLLSGMLNLKGMLKLAGLVAMRFIGRRRVHRSVRLLPASLG